MSGHSCAVADCKRGGRKKDSDTILHRFPKQRSICQVWITKCKRAFFNPKNAYVCSNHFLESDYERDLEHELLELPIRKKRRLKTGAIPSIFESRQPTTTTVPAIPTPREQRMERRKRKLIVEECIRSSRRETTELKNPERSPPGGGLQQNCDINIIKVESRLTETAAEPTNQERSPPRLQRNCDIKITKVESRLIKTAAEPTNHEPSPPRLQNNCGTSFNVTECMECKEKEHYYKKHIQYLNSELKRNLNLLNSLKKTCPHTKKSGELSSPQLLRKLRGT